MSEPRRAGEIEVRDAEPADVTAIGSIGTHGFRWLHHAWFDTHTVETIIGQIYSPESLAACIERCANAADAHFLVACRNNEVVGFLHYDCDGPEPELHRIYLMPTTQRQGIGSALMDELHGRLGPHGSYIVLTAAANEAAFAFYRRHDLRIREVVDGLAYYRDHMGVTLPATYPRVEAVVLERTIRRKETAHESLEAETRPPFRRHGIRETWAQFRGSGAFQDLLAECALWTAPWTSFAPYPDADCAEEFALCAALWPDVASYDDASGAAGFAFSVSARPQPRRRHERR